MDKEIMNVAVIMSLYQGESARNFRLAVLSLLNQQFSRAVAVRIYLGVDGPLTDELEFEVCSMGNVFHKVLRFAENRGLAHVLNDLVNALEGEPFIFRMDTDDYSLPTRFDKQLRYLDENPDVEIVGTSIIEIQEANAERRVVHFARDSVDAMYQMPRRVPVAHPTVCFRSSVFDKVKSYPTIRNNEDVALWFKCAEYGIKISNVLEPLYEFRISGSFWKRRNYRKAFSEFCVYVSGIRSINGSPLSYMYPVFRLVMRLAPVKLQQLAYASTFRNIEIWDGETVTETPI
jgi:hypothetical protein